MKRDGVVKHLGIAFALALVIYFGAFSVLQFLRTRKGGWEVAFQSDQQGAPSLRVDQRYLSLSNVIIDFPGARIDRTNFSAVVRFDEPRTNVPFGKVIYLDTTFLPGAIVLELFGHQLQLLPRVLLVDHQEIPWHAGMDLHLPAAERSSPNTRSSAAARRD